MSVRDLPAVAASLVPAQPVTDAYTMTAGRTWSVVAALIGLAGIVVGTLALTRSAGRTRSVRAVAALLAGLTGAVVGGVVVAMAEGGPGTGYGIVGGVVAVVVGLIAVVLGGLAMARTRRAARPLTPVE
jgi:hypothetical protein